MKKLRYYFFKRLTTNYESSNVTYDDIINREENKPITEDTVLYLVKSSTTSDGVDLFNIRAFPKETFRLLSKDPETRVTTCRLINQSILPNSQSHNFKTIFPDGKLTTSALTREVVENCFPGLLRKDARDFRLVSGDVSDGQQIDFSQTNTRDPNSLIGDLFYRRLAGDLDPHDRQILTQIYPGMTSQRQVVAPSLELQPNYGLDPEIGRIPDIFSYDIINEELPSQINYFPDSFSFSSIYASISNRFSRMMSGDVSTNNHQVNANYITALSTQQDDGQRHNYSLSRLGSAFFSPRIHILEQTESLSNLTLP